jgi:hypothetical protein
MWIGSPTLRSNAPAWATRLLILAILLTSLISITALIFPRDVSNSPGGPRGAFASDQVLSVLPGNRNQRFHEPFKRDLDRLDPRADGWDSEAFSDQALAQLHTLGTIIADRHHGREGELGELVSDTFQSSSLRPAPLVTVYEDALLRVRRSEPREALERAAAETSHGKATMARLMDELISAPGPMTDVHVHFKIIRVEQENARPSTVVYYQLGARTSSGGVQQNATWHCHWDTGKGDSPPKLDSIHVERFEEVVSANGNGSLLFADCTEAVLGRSPAYRQQLVYGIDHWTARIDRRLGLDIVATNGLAVGDVDGDGLDDVYLCEPGGLPNRLFLHKPDGTARDVSAVAGVDFLEPTHAALLLDLDNDGDQDLVIASDRFIILMENDSYGRFAMRMAFRTTSSLVSLAAADYDLDADLDVYACGYFTMEDAAESTVGLGNPIPFHDANNGGENFFLRNEGNWKFADVTRQVGLDQNNQRFSLAASWDDYDNDGDPDLYVANDYGRNCLYRNDGGHFVDVAAQAGVEDISAGMSASWGDYNRDGRLDIYVSNMFSSAGNRISYQRQFKTDASSSIQDHYRRFARGNSLFENAGDGTFRDVTLAAGVTMGRWAWASNFVDINNDGWEDLLVANGMLTRDADPGDL